MQPQPSASPVWWFGAATLFKHRDAFFESGHSRLDTEEFVTIAQLIGDGGLERVGEVCCFGAMRSRLGMVRFGYFPRREITAEAL